MRFVCWQFNVDSPKLEDYCERQGVPNLEVSSAYVELLDSIHTFPNTGTVAIHHLLQHEIEELYVSGISFYRDPYYAGYRARGRR